MADFFTTLASGACASSAASAPALAAFDIARSGGGARVFSALAARQTNGSARKLPAALGNCEYVLSTKRSPCFFSFETT